MTTPIRQSMGTVTRPAIVLLCLALCGSAQAQWAWRDVNGNTTFSDTPPPPTVAQKEILRQPSAPIVSADGRSYGSADSTGSGASYGTSGTLGTNAPANQESAPSSPVAGAAPTGERTRVPAVRTLADQEADFRKRQAERQKAEQKQAQDEAQARQRADVCNQATGYIKMIEDGTRLMRSDAEGNRNVLDEEQRAAEMQKTQNTIAKNC